MKRRVLCLLRTSLHYRRDAFLRGLAAHGYTPVDQLANPTPDDLLLIWNRYGWYASEAKRFERAGARVIVAENGYLGKSWRGQTWFALALGHHAGAGQWNPGGPERWDSWGVPLAPWRPSGGTPLVLGQRGIGEPGIASPDGWGIDVARRTNARLRKHPDTQKNAIPLADDLAGVGCAITWASSAAFFALMQGVPVYHGLACWIGAEASTPFVLWGRGEPKRDDAARLTMFRRLAWSQFTLDEIRDGTAFDRLLRRPDAV